MLTTYVVLNKLVSLGTEIEVTILEIFQCANVIKSRYQEKGVEGKFGLGKNNVYGISCFWALHVFEVAFGSIGIFENAFCKNPYKYLNNWLYNVHMTQILFGFFQGL